MSRAVIDQAGFRIVSIGLILSLLFGFTLKNQIAPTRVRALLQESVSRLEKDFNIDFDSAEVVLSNWGLLLPSLQISNIRVSPKKSICQDSQVFIEKLVLPLSLSALFTSTDLITEIDISRVELRVSDLSHCFDESEKNKSQIYGSNKSNQIQTNKINININKSDSQKSAEASSTNLFESKTAALLKKINVDQIKIISKQYPSQSIDLRHVNIDLSYEQAKLKKIDLASQIYALKDPQSELTYFKGDLLIQATSGSVQQIEAVVKLNGRLLDGEFQFFSLYNSIEKNIKFDLSASRLALKPLVQLKIVDSPVLAFPMTFDFKGYGFYHLDSKQTSEIKLSDIEINGERTHILINEFTTKAVNNLLEVKPFHAEIQKLNLNKLLTLSQAKTFAQSIENLGEFSGSFNYKNSESIDLKGKWSDLEFIFSNRGYRENQKIQSFDVDGRLVDKSLNVHLNQFQINDQLIQGNAQLSYHLQSTATQASADLEGELLNEKIWSLMTQVPQSPNLQIHWDYKKNKEERNQLSLQADQVATHGMKFDNLSIHVIQNLQDGISSSVVMSAKTNHVDIQSSEIKINMLNQIFNSSTLLSEEKYFSDQLHMNFKGPDWRNMSFEAEARFKTQDLKNLGTLKAKGDWTEQDTIAALVSLQIGSKSNRYNLIKDKNNELKLKELE